MTGGTRTFGVKDINFDKNEHATVGDFKCGCRDYASRFFEQLSSSHFYQTIYKPTRIKQNTVTLITFSPMT